tara:strand:+ start:276 stop:668 length:393 start_codon:yes stop_codon:yes gene_type:complete
MMMDFALSKAFRFFLAFTLALGMLISAVTASVSHLPVDLDRAEQVRHAELADTIDDHGHSHEDGELEERHVNHTHGHNPADHSHETPHLIVDRYSIRRDMTRIRFIDVSESNELGSFFRLDRPPKPVSLI